MNGRSDQHSRAYAAPHILLALVVAVWGVCSFFSLKAALDQPWLGLGFTCRSLDAVGLRVESVDPHGPSAGKIFPGDVLLQAASPEGTSVVLEPAMAVPDPDVLPRIAAWKQLLEELRVVDRIVGSGEVFFTVSDGRTVRISPGKTRPFSSLPYDFFVILASSLIALVIVSGIWCRRRDSLPVRLLMLSGIGAAIASFASAVYSTRELTIGVTEFRLLAAANHVGAYAFIAGSVGLLWHYPRRISSFPMARAAAALIAFFWVNEWFGWFELPWHTYSFVAILFFVMSIVFGLVQWRRSRGRPGDRAALKWMLCSIFFIVTTLMAVLYVPSFYGRTPYIPMSWSYMVLLLMYIGCAFAVFRYRLFDIERWWFTVWVWFLAGVSIIAIDFLISMFLPRFSGSYALGVALALVGWGYFPVRQWLWRYVFKRGDFRVERFLPLLASRVAGHIDDDDRSWWGRTLSDIFRPVHMEESPGENDAELRESGERLFVPFPSGPGGVELYYADRGSRLFTAVDVDLAAAMLRLSRSMGDHLRGYSRGMREERRRIMRDLHDDVGGRLLDILHLCGDDDKLRRSVSGAMSSLREVIYYLDDAEPVSLDLALSRWRIFARERCDAAGMELDWPVCDDVGVAILTKRMYYNMNLAVKESVANAVRHGSGELKVDISLTRERISFRFSNRVPECAGHGSGGRGLRNIRSRVRELGGDVESDCADGVFSLSWWVPLPSAAGVSS